MNSWTIPRSNIFTSFTSNQVSIQKKWCRNIANITKLKNSKSNSPVLWLNSACLLWSQTEKNSTCRVIASDLHFIVLSGVQRRQQNKKETKSKSKNSCHVAIVASCALSYCDCLLLLKWKIFHFGGKLSGAFFCFWKHTAATDLNYYYMYVQCMYYNNNNLSKSERNEIIDTPTNHKHMRWLNLKIKMFNLSLLSLFLISQWSRDKGLWYLYFCENTVEKVKWIRNGRSNRTVK